MGASLDSTAAWNFAVALLIGALIGIDREKRKVQEDVGVGGIRTFILLALAGALSAWLSQQLASAAIFVATLLIVSAMVLARYVVQFRVTTEAGALGLTTEVAAVATVLLGAACVAGHRNFAVALGVVTSAVLAFKQPLHTAVGKVATNDIYAALKLLIATFIVLPVLPSRPIDPWGALNPNRLWLLVVLISALSLVGYVAVRLVGRQRGTALTGLFGGLVSSTAVTLTFARQSREPEASGSFGHVLATGLLIAWSVMFVRVIVIVGAVHLPLVRQVVVPFVAMGLTALAAAMVLYSRGPDRTDEAAAPLDVPMSNPFSLTQAVKFGLFFAVVLLGVKLTQVYFPGRGVYVVAALAGLTDVDAITLSMATLAREGGDAATSVTAIVIAAVTNTVVKCGLVLGLGAGTIRPATLVATTLVLAAAGAALFLV